MRQAPIFSLLCLATFAAQSGAQVDPIADAPPAYREAMVAAMRAFTVRNFDDAKSIVGKADASFRQTPVSLNILGAIAIEQRQVQEGRELCLKALNMEPRYFPARFNLAEIPFVEGRYAEARAMFERLQQDEPKDDLLKFRIFLTFLLEKNMEEAEAHLEAIPVINDSPISFYAHAAWDFAHGREKEAKDWITSGIRTFPPMKHINFVEVFYDLGWLKRVDSPGYDPFTSPPRFEE
jgi:tetratricopeptide (TPR) repeat protein